MHKDIPEEDTLRTAFNKGRHPTFDDLNNCFSLYPLADLDSNRQEAISQHISGCSDCLQAVQLIKNADQAWDDPSPLNPVEKEMATRLDQWLNSKPFSL